MVPREGVLIRSVVIEFRQQPSYAACCRKSTITELATLVLLDLDQTPVFDPTEPDPIPGFDFDQTFGA